MIENLLEFSGRVGAVVRREVGQAAHVDGIEGSDEPHRIGAFVAELIRRSGLEEIDGD